MIADCVLISDEIDAVDHYLGHCLKSLQRQHEDRERALDATSEAQGPTMIAHPSGSQSES